MLAWVILILTICFVLTSVLVLSSSEPGKAGNSLYYKELDVEDAEFIAIDKEFDYDYSIIDRIGNTLLIRTNYEAPKYKVIAVDMEKPAKENWVDFIPEKDETMNGASIKGGGAQHRSGQGVPDTAHCPASGSTLFRSGNGGWCQLRLP